MDDRCDTDNSVAAGVSEQSHDGRVCSHPAGNCHYHGAGQHYSGPEFPVVKLPAYKAGLARHDTGQREIMNQAELTA